MEPVITTLCVDDSDDSLSLLQAILDGAGGHRVLTAEDGRTGLELARQSRPDLIVLDLDLPDIHGSEIARLLAADELTSSIPVIAISATSEPPRLMLSLPNLTGFMPKPLADIPAFLAAVDEAVAA